MSYYIVEKDSYLCHYGVGHKDGGGSGRYKWGTGDRPYQRTAMDGKKGAYSGTDEKKRKKYGGTDTSYGLTKQQEIKKAASNLVNDKVLSLLNKKKEESNEQSQKESIDKKIAIENAPSVKRDYSSSDFVESKENRIYLDQQGTNDERFAHEKERILREGTAEEIFSISNYLTNNELQGAYSRLQTRMNLERMLPKEEKKSTFDKIDNAMQKVKKVGEWTNSSINTYNNVAKILNTFAGTNLRPIETNFNPNAVKKTETSNGEKKEDTKKGLFNLGKKDNTKKEETKKTSTKEETKKTTTQEDTKKAETKKTSTKEETKKTTTQEDTKKAEEKLANKFKTDAAANQMAITANREHHKVVESQQAIRDILAKYDVSSKKVETSSNKLKEANNTINPFRNLKINKKGK